MDTFLHGPKLIRLASFVDFEKTKRDEPVLLAIQGGALYIQFNRAKGFNCDSGEKRDQATITKAERDGTQLLAGLSAKEKFTYILSNGSRSARLFVEVCDIVMGNETRPDIMLISVALDASLCSKNAVRAQRKNYTISPIPRPSTRSPHAFSRNPSKLSIIPHPARPTAYPTSQANLTSSPSIQAAFRPSRPPISFPVPETHTLSSLKPGCDRFGVVCENLDRSEEYSTNQPARPLPSANPSNKPVPTIWKVWTTPAEVPTYPAEANPPYIGPANRSDRPIHTQSSTPSMQLTRYPRNDGSSASSSFGSKSVSGSTSEGVAALPPGNPGIRKFNFSSLFEGQGHLWQFPSPAPQTRQTSFDDIADSTSIRWSYRLAWSSLLTVGFYIL